MTRKLAGIACVAALMTPAAAQAADTPWLSQRVMNIAHQGGEDELPSNTMYAYREAVRRGADMLEIDVGATRDGHLVVLHDNTVDRVTNGSGSISDMTLAEIQRLDAAYWFVPGRGTVRDAPASAYRYRGVRAGDRRPPKGYRARDFRIPTLSEVLRAFPRTPINIEIKGRDGTDQATYLRTAELLARTLSRSRRRDIIVASFEQSAVDRFHQLSPRIGVAPGIDGTARFILSNQSPGPGVVAFQVPITYEFGGQRLEVTTPAFVRRAHEAGYAVHVWLSDDREDDATYRRLIRMCVDGIMAARPQALGRVLRSLGAPEPGRDGADPCGTRVNTATARVSGGRVVLPLRRQGESLERRTGTVRLRDGGPRGRVLGSGRYELAGDALTASATVRLNAAVRRHLRSTGRAVLRVEVLEGGRVVSARRVSVR